MREYKGAYIVSVDCSGPMELKGIGFRQRRANREEIGNIICDALAAAPSVVLSVRMPSELERLRDENALLKERLHIED